LLDTYSPEKAAKLFQTFAKNKTWQDPTLVLFWLRLQLLENPEEVYKEPGLQFMPSSLKEERMIASTYRTGMWRPSATPPPKEVVAETRRHFQKQMEMVGEMHRAGVPFLA